MFNWSVRCPPSSHLILPPAHRRIAGGNRGFHLVFTQLRFSGNSGNIPFSWPSSRMRLSRAGDLSRIFFPLTGRGFHCNLLKVKVLGILIIGGGGGGWFKRLVYNQGLNRMDSIQFISIILCRSVYYENVLSWS